MIVKAKAKYIRLSPRKARLVADVVRGLDLQEAFDKLAVINKKAVKPIAKLLSSALSNAEHNNNIEKSNLILKEIRVNEGPTFYRWMPRAFGRATQLRKRTSMIDVILEEKVASTPAKATKKEEIETVNVEEKTKDSNISEKVSTESKNPSAIKDAELEKEDEKAENKRTGGHREIQQKGKNEPKKKGVLKKMFRRKSGM